MYMYSKVRAKGRKRNSPRFHFEYKSSVAYFPGHVTIFACLPFLSLSFCTYMCVYVCICLLNDLLLACGCVCMFVYAHVTHWAAREKNGMCRGQLIALAASTGIPAPRMQCLPRACTVRYVKIKSLALIYIIEFLNQFIRHKGNGLKIKVYL